ncbi:putative gustatory receptor 28b isoform X3 [Microplitis mediator]|uniref:putative gustatory receptor 28b isoform X3 n=1 Tax=Microplitis mediator TaxID=375433 RepID=UPI0025544E4F|nr:putative gustatory receptor 28b isoform X3 [Microplitis mediator]
MYYNKYVSVYHHSLFFIQYIFFKIIGLSPWTISNFEIYQKNRKINNDQNICKFSYFGTFYNVLLIIMMTIITIYASYNERLMVKRIDSLLTKRTISSIETVAVLVALIYLSVYIFRQKLMIGVFNRLKIVDSKLQKCAAYSFTNDITLHIIFIVNLLICCSLMVYYFHRFSLVDTIIKCTPSVISTWLVIQYVMLLNMINKRFKSINYTIGKIIEVYKNENQPETVCISRTTLFRGSLIHDINNIKYAYIKLCEICEALGDFFGFSVLTVLIFVGAGSVFVAYFGILPYFEKQNPGIGLIETIPTFWMNFSIFMLSTYVNKIIKQSTETPTIINLLMDGCTIDENVEKELVKFVRDLLYLKVGFTACDIISLDRTLIGTIVGTVATYLIILIQFRPSD